MAGLRLVLQSWPQRVCLSPAWCPGPRWLPDGQIRVWEALSRTSPPKTVLTEERGLLPAKLSLPLAYAGANPQCWGHPSARPARLGAGQAPRTEGPGTWAIASKMCFSITAGIFCPASQVSVAAAPCRLFPGPCCMCATCRTVTIKPTHRTHTCDTSLTDSLLL